MYLPIKLVIADDHEVYRDGLKALLERVKRLQLHIVGEASNGKELVAITEQVQPDIVLTDIMMPVMDGIEATRIITTAHPTVRVIALSMFNQDNLVLDMFTHGATGYLIKNAHKDEIVEAIETVFAGHTYYCRSTSMKLARLIAAHKPSAGPQKQKVSFSERELQVIRLICLEKTTKEISDELNISPRTVEEHRIRIRDKMDVKSTTGIVIYAIRHQLFKIDQ